MDVDLIAGLPEGVAAGSVRQINLLDVLVKGEARYSGLYRDGVTMILLA
jgi:hypothetical protein